MLLFLSNRFSILTDTGGLVHVEDMIKKILSIDKLARDAKNRMQRENVTWEETKKARKKEIREDYLKRAYERIEHNSLLEKESAERIINEAKAKTEEKLKELNKISEEKEEFWVNEIVKRSLMSEG